MKFNLFTSKLLTSVAALALTSAWANAAVTKDHRNDKGFNVVAVTTLQNTKVADLLLLNGQGGKQFLYLACADGKLSIFDASHPAHLRELSSWRVTSSDTQNFHIETVNDRFVVASDARTNDHVAVLDLSNAASEEIARQFKDVDAYAVDDNKQILYVAQPGQLTVVRFDHPISRDAERFEESYEAR